MDYQNVVERLTILLRNDDEIFAATGGHIWHYSPETFRSRGKQFSRRNAVRRRRFWSRLRPQVTVERFG